MKNKYLLFQGLLKHGPVTWGMPWPKSDIAMVEIVRMNKTDTPFVFLDHLK